MKTRFDGDSELVAELVTVNGFKAAYAIKDGAEGPRGWVVCPFICPPVFFSMTTLQIQVSRMFNTIY